MCASGAQFGGVFSAYDSTQLRACLDSNGPRGPRLFRPIETREAELRQPLFTPDIIDGWINSPFLGTPYFEIKKRSGGVREIAFTKTGNYRNVTIPDVLDPLKIQNLFGDGATLIFNHMEDIDPLQRAAVAQLSQILGCLVQTVSFVSPAGNAGLNPHYDTFEGFILQTAGEKVWRIYRPLGVNPPRRPKGLSDADLEGLALDLVVTLRPGDLLYLPAGAPHVAESGPDQLSAHVTFMAYPSNRVTELLGAEIEVANSEVCGTSAIPWGVPASEVTPGDFLDIVFHSSPSEETLWQERMEGHAFSDEWRLQMADHPTLWRGSSCARESSAQSTFAPSAGLQLLIDMAGRGPGVCLACSLPPEQADRALEGMRAASRAGLLSVAGRCDQHT